MLFGTGSPCDTSFPQGECLWVMNVVNFSSGLIKLRKGATNVQQKYLQGWLMQNSYFEHDPSLDQF